MNALYLTMFVSAVVVGFAALAFFVSFRQRDHEHADRLSSLPLEDDSRSNP